MCSLLPLLEVGQHAGSENIHIHNLNLLYSVVEALRRPDGVVKILGHSSEPVLSQLDLNATAQGTKRAAARPLSATPSLLPLPRRTLKLCSLCR